MTEAEILEAFSGFSHDGPVPDTILSILKPPAMNAKEAKAATYSVRPPVRPPQPFFDAITKAASEGKRSISVHYCGGISEENKWWLEDEGYYMTEADTYDPTVKVVVMIHW